MRKRFAVTLFLTAFLFSKPCDALHIRLYGRSGMEISNSGNVRICPGITWNCCAVVHISWRDVWDILTGVAYKAPVIVEFPDSDMETDMVMIVNNVAIFDGVDESTVQIEIADDEVVEFIND